MSSKLGVFLLLILTTCLLALLAFGIFLVLDRDPPRALALIRVQTTAETPEAREAYRQTQIALFKSPYVMSSALRTPEVALILNQQERPSEWLMENIEVEYADESDILRVELSMNEAEKEKAVQLVDAVTDAFMEEVAADDRNERAGELEILRAEFRQSQRDLQQLTTEMQNLAAKLGATGSEASMIRRELAMDEVRAISRRIQNLEEERISANIMEQSGDAEEVKVARKRMAVIDKMKEAQQKTLDEAKQNLFDSVGFSAELETRRMEVESIKSRVTELGKQIQDAEFDMKKPPTIKLIQRAQFLYE